ncbi:cupin [bacterium]|nr:cupin [bacterium]
MLTLNKHPSPSWGLFLDNGTIPNSRHPVLVYKNAFDFTDRSSVYREVEVHVSAHGWRLEWEWRIYRYTHWHSTAHEALACIEGDAVVEVGGPQYGEEYNVIPGTIMVIPAGVAHRNKRYSSDFKVLGMYPEEQKWNLIKGARTFSPIGRRQSRKVPVPRADPFFGPKGPLTKLWHE